MISKMKPLCINVKTKKYNERERTEGEGKGVWEMRQHNLNWQMTAPSKSGNYAPQWGIAPNCNIGYTALPALDVSNIRTPPKVKNGG